jgi:hypothetical protein
MTQRDRAAVHVDPFAIESEFLFYCEVLSGKRFIDFD